MAAPEKSLIVASSGALPTFAMNDEAKRRKEQALTTAALIGKVTDHDSKVKAVRAQMELKQQISAIEKARKDLKEPLLKAGRELDTLCATESLELEKEYGRVSNVVKEFDDAERRRVAEEERLQREELARIEREKQAEIARLQREQQEREAEARRQQAEREEQARIARETAERQAREARELAEKQAREAREAAERVASEEREAAEQKAAEATTKRQREAAERERVAAEQRAETARIEAENQAAEAQKVADQQAEAARLLAEQTEAAAKQEREKMEAELARQAQETAQQTEAIEDKAGDAAYVAAKPIEITTVAGQRQSSNWIITVEQPFVLAKHHPDLVDIKPRLQDIKAALNEGREIKGITAVRETVSGVRLKPERKAIDV